MPGGIFLGFGFWRCYLYLDRSKNFMKTKGRCDAVQNGILYIEPTCEIRDICPVASKKWQKLRQNPFVKMHKTKIAISGQILRFFAKGKLNLPY